MQRRQFLIGAGSAALGGSALLGSGAFTRVESHRGVTVQVAEDPSAYLGLAKCPGSANGSYAWLDGEGHLEVLMNPDNPTIGETPLGEGVNSDSSTWFHSVFQLCNQGKEAVCVYIEDDPAWPTVPEGERDAGERRVEFYLRDDPGRSLIGESNALALPVGECACVGLRTRTYGLSEGDELLSALDNEVTITADVNLDCVDPEEPVGSAIELTDLTTEPSTPGVQFHPEFAFTATGPETAQFLLLTFGDGATPDLSAVDGTSVSLTRNGSTLDVASASASGADTVVVELASGYEITPDDAVYELVIGDVTDADDGSLTLALHEDDGQTPSAPAFATAIGSYQVDSSATDQVQLADDPVARDGDLLSTDPTNAKIRFRLENTGSTPVTVQGIRFDDTSSDAARASAFWEADFGATNPVVAFEGTPGDGPAIETDGNPSVSLFFRENGSLMGVSDWPHPEAYPAEEFYPFDDGSGDWGDPAMPGTVHGGTEKSIPAGETVVVELGEFRLASVLTPNAVDMLGETVTLTLVLADGSEQQFELSIEDTWALTASKTVSLLGLPVGELQLYNVPFSDAYEVRNNSWVGSDTLFATIEGTIDWDNGETTDFDIDPFGVTTVAPDGNPGDDPGIEDTGGQTPAELVVENVHPVDASVPETDFA
jgi:hypothetical protein